MEKKNTTGSVVINDINDRIKLLIESVLRITPYEFSKSLNKNRPDWLYKILKKEVSPSPKTLNLIFEKYPDYKLWVLTGEGPIGKNENIETRSLPINPTKEDALKLLNLIQKNKKQKNSFEGRLIDERNLVETTQYIIPIPGQAGLKKAFFAPDEYIEQNFIKESIFVKPSERAEYYKIEVDGNSMPGVLDPGDWARCEDIPKIYWLEKGTFKPNKVYCLFHRTRGPLFKRISKTFLDSITLSSDNTDKDEYPDEVFDLAEFSKILIVRKVEKDL